MNLSNIFTDKSTLNKCLDDLRLSKKGDYVRDNFVKTIIPFYRKHDELISKFYEEQSPISRLCPYYVNFLNQTPTLLSKNLVLTSLKHVDEIVDHYTKEILKKIPFKKEINIFGFGIGDGWYEKDIAKYLIAKNHCNKVNIYGFDPNAIQSDFISFINADDLLKKIIPKFDLFFSRWVLHHIPQTERWKKLSLFMNHLSRSGYIFIVEEGPFLSRLPIKDKQLYIMLSSLTDIFVNYYVYPDWTTNPDAFHLKYLNHKDLEKIGNNLTFKFKSKVVELDACFFKQYFVTYQPTVN